MPQKTPQRQHRAKNGTAKPRARAKAKSAQVVELVPPDHGPGASMETASQPLARVRMAIALHPPEVPVFSTAQPPKGLSGWIQKAASARPNHTPGHWRLLRLADRVDAWAQRLRKSLPWAAPSAAALVAGGLVWRARRA
ncbi:hypothetical protein [Corallococcus aberystwythensis]|uniref:Uncharacterized protein n=1 Tax=Corallococcus aberystwythensis TaxID=2316722 RepID=A0A3A8QK08_9BACT|nr:hypothetical protein [Corallococcus aberystwythensis]RKH63524.1 hypothetical protein D7W81_20225 [Corallococcus aberystwythensis]